MENEKTESDYRHRSYNPEFRDKYLNTLLTSLRDLEERTQPLKGEASAKGKDGAAFDALSLAMDLVEAVAGWAIDHQIGLAVSGLSYVPLQPSGTATHPKYLAMRKAVDSHEHERAGSTLNSVASPDNQQYRRKALVNLLQTMSSSSTQRIFGDAEEALRALEYGEVLQIVAPKKSGHKSKYQERRFQLQAIGFVEHLVALGVKKLAAQVEVGSYFGVADATLRTWEKRLRLDGSGAGPLTVAREVSFAQNAASYVIAARRGDEMAVFHAKAAKKRYGSESMQSAGQEFQKIGMLRDDED